MALRATKGDEDAVGAGACFRSFSAVPSWERRAGSESRIAPLMPSSHR
jgi:hypothetical protein